MAASVRISSDMARLATNDHSPDIFTIVCCNECFQLALDLATIKTLLRVCKRAHPLLSSKVARLHSWCRKAGLCRPDRSPRIVLTPSDQISLSLHCDDQETADRSWLENQSSWDNAAASYLLARILQVEIDRGGMRPLRVEAKSRRVFDLLETAANSSHPMAQFHLAKCYQNGHGVDQDSTKAVELYCSLANRGILQAQISLGRCYDSGLGVEQDSTAASKWYSKAAHQGNGDGSLHVLFLRGWLPFINYGIPQSNVDAVHHWQEVSTQSTNPVIKTIATHMVGWMHYLGRGTERDEQKGIKIIRDNESDEFELGEDNCLAAFVFSQSDSLESRKFFELCQLGSERDWLCKHLVAVCLINGFGTAANAEMAACIFEQLANEGHSDSQYWIGCCFLNGWSRQENPKKAFECFSKSADQGNSYGQWMVGDCFRSGSGVAKNDTKAAEWFRKSGEQGNRYGEYSIGNCYHNGWGVAKNIDTALFWYRQSAGHGHGGAINSLLALGSWP